MCLSIAFLVHWGSFCTCKQLQHNLSQNTKLHWALEAGAYYPTEHPAFPPKEGPGVLMLCGHRSSGHRPWSPFLRGDLISFDVVITFLDAATLWLSSFPFWSASIISLGGGPSQEEDTLEFHFEGGNKVTKRLAHQICPLKGSISQVCCCGRTRYAPDKWADLKLHIILQCATTHTLHALIHVSALTIHCNSIPRQSQKLWLQKSLPVKLHVEQEARQLHVSRCTVGKLHIQ